MLLVLLLLLLLVLALLLVLVPKAGGRIGRSRHQVFGMPGTEERACLVEGACVQCMYE